LFSWLSPQGGKGICLCTEGKVFNAFIDEFWPTSFVFRDCLLEFCKYHRCIVILQRIFCEINSLYGHTDDNSTSGKKLGKKTPIENHPLGAWRKENSLTGTKKSQLTKVNCDIGCSVTLLACVDKKDATIRA